MTDPAAPQRTQAWMTARLESLATGTGVVKQAEGPALARAVLVLLKRLDEAYPLTVAEMELNDQALAEALRILSDAMGERGG